MGDCSKFLPQRRRALGRRSWNAVSVVQPVPRSMMNAGVVHQEVQRHAVERPPGPAPVHGHTGTPARRVCTLFAPAHDANADGKAAEWRGRVDWTGRRVEPLHSWPPGDDLVGTTGCRPVWHFRGQASSAPTQQRETGSPSETASDECYVTASEYRSSVRQFVWLANAHWHQSPDRCKVSNDCRWRHLSLRTRNGETGRVGDHLGEGRKLPQRALQQSPSREWF